MKNVMIFTLGTLLLAVAVILIVGGGFASFIGFIYAGVLYIHGCKYPRFWQRFWITNKRILQECGMWE